MKKTLFFAALLGFCLNALAYQFSKENAEGVSIYYNILSDNAVEVTFGTFGGYSGEVIIPEQVEYEGNTYTVTKIGNGAFLQCMALTMVKANVTRIDQNAFQACTSLKYAQFGSNLERIDNNAFAMCQSLDSIRFLSQVPPEISDNAFNGVNPSVIVYVPCDYVESYASASYWSNFSNIMGDCGESALQEAGTNDLISIYPNPAHDFITIQGLEKNQQVVIYNALGERVLTSDSNPINIQSLNQGVYFIQIFNTPNPIILRLSIH